MDTLLLTEIKNSINPNNEDDSLNPLIDQCYSFLQSNINEYPSNEHKTYLNEVLRFYTFEKKDVSSSFTRWQKWAAYRSKYHPESITEKDIPIQIKTGKAFIHGHDKEGRPCVVIKQSLHIPGETDMEEMIRYGFYIMEKALNEAAKVNKKDIVLLMDRIDFGWSNSPSGPMVRQALCRKERATMKHIRLLSLLTALTMLVCCVTVSASETVWLIPKQRDYR